VTLDLLHRLRLAEALDMSAESKKGLTLYMRQQARLLADLMLASPCPNASKRAAEASGAELDDLRLEDVLARLQPLEETFIRQVHLTPVPLTEHALGVADVGAAVGSICAEYDQLLKIGHARFVKSTEYEQLLAQIGAYQDDVTRRVNADDLAEIRTQIIRESARALGHSGLQSTQ